MTSRAPPRLIVITDTEVASEADIERRVERLLAASAPHRVMVQLRDRKLSARRRMAFGARLLDCCRRFDQWFVVNDRADIAVLLGADGVHLGEDAVEPAEARPLLGNDAWISRACHDPGDVARVDIDAMLLSPIVEPRKGRAALGFAGLRAARRCLGLVTGRPVPALYALGGVRAETASACIAAGADGVAVIGAGLADADPYPLLDAVGIPPRK